MGQKRIISALKGFQYLDLGPPPVEYDYTLSVPLYMIWTLQAGPFGQQKKVRNRIQTGPHVLGIIVRLEGWVFSGTQFEILRHRD